MGFFDLFKHTDINQGVAQFQQTSNAMLVDVRTPEEYRDGHIPGSINLPSRSILSSHANCSASLTALSISSLDIFVEEEIVKVLKETFGEE